MATSTPPAEEVTTTPEQAGTPLPTSTPPLDATETPEAPTATEEFISEAAPATIAPQPGGFSSAVLPSAGDGPPGRGANMTLFAVIVVSLATGIIAFRFVAVALEDGEDKRS